MIPEEEERFPVPTVRYHRVEAPQHGVSNREKMWRSWRETVVVLAATKERLREIDLYWPPVTTAAINANCFLSQR